MPVSTRYPPNDPREWLNRARSDLTLTRAQLNGVLYEDLCFHAQQAAEKAMKAVLTWRDVEFPYVHDLGQLLLLIERSGISLTPAVRAAIRLTPFAVIARYPGFQPPVTAEEYQEALRIAEEVVRWAEHIVESGMPR